MIILKNEASPEKIDRKYRGIIGEAVDVFREAYGDDIREIRLQGSVSRGMEIPHVSDLDLMCILKDDCETSEPERVKAARASLSRKLDDLRGVDLNVTNEKFISEHYDYRLLICTDSLCLYGDNRYFEKEIAIPGAELAELWNPDTRFLIGKYGKSLVSSEENDAVKEISRLTGKDLLKSYRPWLMREFEIFHRGIAETCEDLCAKDPANGLLYRRLLDLYLAPTDDKGRIMETLELAGRMLERESSG